MEVRGGHPSLPPPLTISRGRLESPPWWRAKDFFCISWEHLAIYTEELCLLKKERKKTNTHAEMFFPGDARSDVITWKCPGAFQSKCTKMEGLLKGGNRPVLYLSVGQGFVILVLLFFYQHLVIWSFTLHTQLLFLLLLVLHFHFKWTRAKRKDHTLFNTDTKRRRRTKLNFFWWLHLQSLSHFV